MSRPAKDEPQAEPKAETKAEPTEVKRVFAFGRIGKWFGKLLGGDGKRAGARDTDPGS